MLKISYSPRLAIDFDNTIVAYDELFVAAARERKLIGDNFKGTKVSVREAVRLRGGGESEWQELQADIYGEMIGRAPSFPGVREFIVRARELGARVAIVSHKAPFAAARPSGMNLRHAARCWLLANRLLGCDVVAESNLYFEASRPEKLARIRALKANIVIDDLAEVLTDPQFPADARRWLFSPGAVSGRRGSLESFGSWQEMSEALER